VTPWARAFQLLLAVAASAGIVSANSILFNWTPYATSSGTLGGGVPEIAPFPGGGSEAAVRLQVGQAASLAGPAAPRSENTEPQGGGLRQPLLLTGRPFELAVNVAVLGGRAPDPFGGVAQLRLDGAVVDSHDFGRVNSGEYLFHTLGFRSTSIEPAGYHMIEVQFLRPVYVIDGASPYQYIDAWRLDYIENPEPGPAALVLLGLAAVAVRARRKLRTRAC
jgi:MYXO-CTERM domain-containing protein